MSERFLGPDAITDPGLQDRATVAWPPQLKEATAAEAGAFNVLSPLADQSVSDRSWPLRRVRIYVERNRGRTTISSLEIGLSVCYDIRFPELFRTYALKGVKMVLSPMAFPHPRLPHWKALVRARAIENQMFMVGTNQVGDEDFGPDGKVTYFGDSCVIDPWGETALEASETGEELLTTTVDLGLIDQIRAKMHVLSDRRPDSYALE